MCNSTHLFLCLTTCIFFIFLSYFYLSFTFLTLGPPLMFPFFSLSFHYFAYIFLSPSHIHSAPLFNGSTWVLVPVEMLLKSLRPSVVRPSVQMQQFEVHSLIRILVDFFQILQNMYRHLKFYSDQIIPSRCDAFFCRSLERINYVMLTCGFELLIADCTFSVWNVM